MTQPEKKFSTEEERKGSSFLNIALFILLILTAICVSLFVYFKSRGIDLKDISLMDFIKAPFSSENESDETPEAREIKYEYGKHPVFSVYNGYIIECTKDSIRGLNEKGEEQWAVPVSVNNPVLKAADGKLLIGDLEGKEIYLLDGKRIKWDKKLDNNIINVDINNDGYISVIHEAEGYKGEVTVFNHNGNEVLSRTVSDSFPLFSRVSPSGKQLLINSVNISGIKAATDLTSVDMKGNGSKDITPREDIIFPFTWYLSSGLLAAVNDSSVICFDESLKEKWKYEFKDKKAYCSDILQGKYLVLAVSGQDKTGSLGNNAADIEIYDKEGKRSKVFSAGSSVKNIKTYSDIIGINTGREIFFINSKGTLLDKCTSKTDVSEIFFINRNEVAFVTKSKIIINQLNT